MNLLGNGTSGAGLGLLLAAVDWDLAARFGSLLVPCDVWPFGSPLRGVAADLECAALRAEEPVCELTGLGAGLPDSTVRVVDRSGWIAATVHSMARLAGDSDAGFSLGSLPGVIPVGASLAFLSSGVLGQYDPFTGEDGTLLLVAPNIVAVERELGVDPGDFRLWVCLHEMTHRVQFAASPWLADHLYGIARLAAEGSGGSLSGMVRPVLDQLIGTGDYGEHGGVIGMLRGSQGPLQRVALDRLTALGTLLEGHAEHVMDAVGPSIVPTVAHIREAFGRRRVRTGNPLQRVLRAMFGVDVKMAQYVRGRAFVDTVIERVGMEQFNVVWTDETTLPRLSEIDSPERWVERVLG